MKDQDKTREQLINELVGMRQRVAELEGSLVTLEPQEATRTLGTITDSPRAVELEETRKESEARFRQFAELLPAFIFEIDSTGRFTFLNLVGIEAAGYTSSWSSGDTILNSLRSSGGPSDQVSVASPISPRPIPALGGNHRRSKSYRWARADGYHLASRGQELPNQQYEPIQPQSPRMAQNLVRVTN